MVRSWVSTFVLVDLLDKNERWTFPLNGAVIYRRGSPVQPWSILIGTVHCINGHRPSGTLLGPIVLEGTRPSNVHGPQGTRPPMDKGLSTINNNQSTHGGNSNHFRTGRTFYFSLVVLHVFSNKHFDTSLIVSFVVYFRMGHGSDR